MKKIKGRNEDLIIIQVYTPTSKYTNEEGEECYKKQEDILEDEKEDNVKVVRNWNAVVKEGS